MHLRRNDDRVGRGDEGILVDSFADVSQWDFGGQSFPVCYNWFIIPVVYIDYAGYPLVNPAVTVGQ